MSKVRIERLLERAESMGLEAVVIVPGPNMFYLTGVRAHMTEGPVMLFFPIKGEPFIFCPAVDADRLASRTGIEKRFAWNDSEGPGPVLTRALEATGLGRGILGVEYRCMRVLERELLASAIRRGKAIMEGNAAFLQYEDAGLLLSELRMQKDEQELDLVQQAARIADTAMRVAHQSIRPGVRELDIVAYIDKELQKLGVDSYFHIAVASGPRSAVPHSKATDRVIQDGELVCVEFVCHYRGYVGDIARTFPVGDVSGELAEIYRTCLEAQARALAEAKPGITCAGLDAASREYITSKGYGQYSTHRTGRGLGLEVHEEPYIVGSNHRPLEQGNVFTIEPGIYVPGLGGVRIEDDVVLVPGGARVLTQYPRDFLR